tara:strand:- start:726 stop:2237 length:1512 start_codon:yes stop_codon:yes gene_type:complete
MANEVIINVKADTDKANKGLKGIGQNLSRVARTAGIAASAMGAVAAVAIKSFVGAAMEQERALATLGATIENTGVSFESVKGQILSATAALQNKTNFGDEQQIRTLAILTTVLGDVDQAMLALPAVMDASSASGLQMESVAKTMGKALAGNVHQAESVGLVFDKAAGFSERLEQVLGKVGGAAEANVDPFTQLGNDVGDLKEAIGKALIPVLLPLVSGLRDIMKRLQTLNPSLIKFGAIALAVAAAVGLIGGPLLLFISLVPAIVAGMGMIGTAITVMLGPVGWVVAAVGLLFLAFKNNFFGIRDIAVSIFEQVGNVISDAIGWVIKQINKMIEGFNKVAKFFGKEIPTVEEMGKSILDLGKQVKNTAGDYVQMGKDWAFTTDQMIADTNKLQVANALAGATAATPTGVGLDSGDMALDFSPKAGGGRMGGGAKADAYDDSRFMAGLDWMNTLAQTRGTAPISGQVVKEGLEQVNRGYRLDNAGNIIVEYLGDMLEDTDEMMS